MSALTPHIRVLRVEAAALLAIGQEAHADAKVSTEAGERESALIEFTAAMVVTRMAQAKFAAADRLDAEEQGREEKLSSCDLGRGQEP